MTIELDIHRSAFFLIKQHGHRATIQAAAKADEMMERGDLQGQAIWMRVAAAIEDLLSEGPKAGQVIH